MWPQTGYYEPMIATETQRTKKNTDNFNAGQSDYENQAIGGTNRFMSDFT